MIFSQIDQGCGFRQQVAALALCAHTGPLFSENGRSPRLKFTTGPVRCEIPSYLAKEGLFQQYLRTVDLGAGRSECPVSALTAKMCLLQHWPQSALSGPWCMARQMAGLSPEQSFFFRTFD
jgi:hypothetical protein